MEQYDNKKAAPKSRSVNPQNTVSGDVLDYLAGRGEKHLRMLEHVAICEQHLGPVMAVNNALIQDKLAVDILFVDHFSAAVELV